ncbi:ATP11 protein-domain-containing protein [Schizothecium vesticola]|uniref:ATP11 protein-domain-containing protein n=1 Tax=Schizothecium vesticola TaxID=314040 RepID=A0AA40EVK7_9PEZI|nr:ATP11 protein-domain-containing protein [Schizothecium vesticola]
MAAARTPVLRHLVRSGSTPRIASFQRRWAQVHDVRFLATTQPSRSVLEKYRDKLDRKAREEGLPDIDTLKKAYSDKIDSLRKEFDTVVPVIPPTPPPSPQQQQQQPRQQPPPPPPKSRPTAEGVQPLSSILHLPKARLLPAAELTAAWIALHTALPRSLSAVIPAATYAGMDAAARACPQFLVPVPHAGQGAELHFLQWTWDAATRSSTVLFTQLAEYKARGEYAAPHTTVTHYADLAGEEGGLVLMRGAVAEDRGVKVEDARWLVMCLQRFYGGWDGEAGKDGMGRERAEERRRLLEEFARGDQRFSVERLLEEAERMG